MILLFFVILRFNAVATKFMSVSLPTVVIDQLTNCKKCFYADGKVDLNTLSLIENFVDLIKVLPSIPGGYLITIFAKFQTFRNDDSSKMMTDDSNQILDSETHATEIVEIIEEDSGASTIDVDLTEGSTEDSFIGSATSDASSLSSTEVPPSLTTTRPIPKKFPIAQFNFGLYAQEVIKTGNLTETGKCEITTAVINVMRKYQRYVDLIV